MTSTSPDRWSPSTHHVDNDIPSYPQLESPRQYEQKPGAVGASPESKPVSIALLIIGLIGCPPLGIVALYFAAQMRKRLAIGDTIRARTAGQIARIACYISIALNIVGLLGSLSGSA